jgi:hypothetical protein
MNMHYEISEEGSLQGTHFTSVGKLPPTLIVEEVRGLETLKQTTEKQQGPFALESIY